jgi:hypothetical protein
MEPYLSSYAHLPSRTLFRMLAAEPSAVDTPDKAARFDTIREILAAPRWYKFRLSRNVFVDKEL